MLSNLRKQLKSFTTEIEKAKPLSEFLQEKDTNQNKMLISAFHHNIFEALNSLARKTVWFAHT